MNQLSLFLVFVLGLTNSLFYKKRAKENWSAKEASSSEKWQVKLSEDHMDGRRRSSLAGSKIVACLSVVTLFCLACVPLCFGCKLLWVAVILVGSCGWLDVWSVCHVVVWFVRLVWCVNHQTMYSVSCFILPPFFFSLTLVSANLY